MASSKRVRGSPTGLTPRKPHKVARSKAPKSNTGRKLEFDRGEDQETSWTPSESVGAELNSINEHSPVSIQTISAASSDTGQVQVNVLSTHEVIRYIVPSFSIVSLKLRRARATFGTSSKQVDIFLNDNSCIPDKVPFSIKVEQKCTVEVCKRTLCIPYTVCNINSVTLKCNYDWSGVKV